MRNFFILLTFLPVNLFSQDRTLYRTIEWQDNKNLEDFYFQPEFRVEKNECFYFRNAVIENSQTLFPYYNELITTGNYYSGIEIMVKELVFAVISPKDYESVGNIDLLPVNFEWKSKTVMDRKTPGIAFSLLPLRKNPATGNIEKLVSFAIALTPSKTQPFKSTLSEENHAAYGSTSVLATGEWHKIKLSKSGIYKMTYNDLINLGISNPSGIRVYGNGGKTLPLMNSQPYPDDLKENAIYMYTGQDGIFNSGDYILFYARGVVSWNYDTTSGMYIHSINDYSAYTCYYLTSSLGPGKKIQAAQDIQLPATDVADQFDAYGYHERNLENVIESGRVWYGESLIYNSFDTTFIFTDHVPGSPVNMLVNVLGRSSANRTFAIKVNGASLGSITTNGVSLNSITSPFARQNSKKSTFTVPGDAFNVSVSFGRITDSDRAWLDYIIVNGRRQLNYSEKPLYFRDMETVGSGHVTEFRVNGASSQTIVWDLTDIYNIRQLNTYSTGEGIAFKAATDTLHEFVVFDQGLAFLTPQIDQSDKTVANQNLHEIQPHKMIIITAPEFIDQAERLAEFHRQKDNFSVYVATTSEIYNEFSSGMRDVSALRNFVRSLYEKQGSDDNALKYLLLFGDGSFNNRSDDPDNPNFIPTYQSENSLLPTESYVSDDFFGFLDSDEGGSSDMKAFVLDLGIGRLPVKDTTEAADVIGKIMSYNTSTSMQDWRNNIMFIGDDEDGNSHMDSALALADFISNNYPEYSVKKIMLDAYKQTSTSSGNRYPDVNRAIIDNLNRGALIFNYTGHGGETGLAHEHILENQDIRDLNNTWLPLFVTATCEFSRFDYMAINEDGKYKEQTTAGELALLNPRGGAIALLSTTRVVWSYLNAQLNQKFYDVMFLRDAQGNRYRLGDMVKEAKNAAGIQLNKLNFSLLGDPAMALAYPEYNIVTDSINGVSVSEPIDTLKAFAKIRISGRMTDHENMTMDAFNGLVYPSVFDKKQVVTTLANDGGDPISFTIQENLLYRGKATVSQGHFSFEFIVPKDIAYNIGTGKINYYAENEITDANGSFSAFNIGGTSENSFYDNEGPLVDLYLNDENFRSGGITNTNPKVFARVWDENGINTIGNGIGHDIVAVLDGNTSNPLIINDYYQTHLDDYRGGEITYQLHDLTPGLHTLNVKVWDIFNNSSLETIGFYVIESEKLVLEKVYNFPNPVVDRTFFQFEHNMPGTEFVIHIDIFDFSGRLINRLSAQDYGSGYRSEAIEWDAKDMNGNKLSRGVYPYRLKVETQEGQVAEKFGKLIVFN